MLKIKQNIGLVHVGNGNNSLEVSNLVESLSRDKEDHVVKQYCIMHDLNL